MTSTYVPDVPVHQIRIHGNNPRRDIGDTADLQASITALGLLEPLVLAPLPSGVEFLLIAGHRRFAAIQAAGITTVPAMLREDLDTPPKQLEAMLVENTQRVDLTPAEEAKAYAQLVAFPGYTPAKAAKATGRSVKAVKGRLALATLPEATLEKMHTGQITIHDAAVLVEFVGTPHYKDLVRDAGTSSFKYTVERVRSKIRDAELFDVVKAHATEHGWPMVTSWSDVGESVIRGYQLKSTAKVTAALAELDGPHVVHNPGYGGWSVCKPRDPREDVDEEAPVDVDREAARVECEQRAAELAIARKVRTDHLTGRLKALVLKPGERLAILRLMLAERVENGDWADEDLALAGFPAKADGTERKWGDSTDDLMAYVAGVNENQAWKALIVLSFAVVSANYDMESIRVAQALGYELSDVEKQLLGGESA